MYNYEYGEAFCKTIYFNIDGSKPGFHLVTVRKFSATGKSSGQSSALHVPVSW